MLISGMSEARFFRPDSRNRRDILQVRSSRQNSLSLGHSTVVIIVTIIVAATSAALAAKFDSFQKVGGIIGVSVSCSFGTLNILSDVRFLLVIALANTFVLASQVKTYRVLRAQKLLPPEERATNDDILKNMGGKMMRIFNKLFKFIDRPWKMYPLGFLFGLGFDTSTEVALLGIASVEASKGTSFWLLLLFPLVFTSGMCLIGTSHHIG
jgi:high-affinity nickel-transport protein